MYLDPGLGVGFADEGEIVCERYRYCFQIKFCNKFLAVYY